MLSMTLFIAIASYYMLSLFKNIYYSKQKISANTVAMISINFPINTVCMLNEPFSLSVEF